jgi:hypothetical protein
MFNNFAKDGLKIFGDKLFEASENLKNIDKNQTIYIYQSIILSSILFGSVYIFSTSLIGINKMFLKNRNFTLNFIIINGLIITITSSILIYFSMQTF